MATQQTTPDAAALAAALRDSLPPLAVATISAALNASDDAAIAAGVENEIAWFRGLLITLVGGETQMDALYEEGHL